jgi:delta-aminolevulinic acid dehydratase/porphobilinogen synthase
MNSIKKGLVDDKIIYETLTSFKRAGANAIISYFSTSIAKNL